ncbi:MAG: EAL domain-containing protein, partial [Rhodospirillales bacterium]|nr:EAL domain-containing protein [Rhodospirillales bacterium]
ADALAHDLCDFAHRAAGGRIASIMHLGADGSLHPLALAGGSEALAADLDGLVPGPHAGSCGAAVHLGAPVMVRDASTDPRWSDLRAAAERHGVRSCWSHPVWKDGAAIGTFAITGSAPGEPSAAIRRLLEHGAAIAGSILQLLGLQRDQVRAAERARRLAGFNAMLAQVNQLAAGRPDETTLYEGICGIAVAEGGLRLVWIGTPDAGFAVRPTAAAGATGFLDRVSVSADAALPEGRGLSGTAWREARTVVRQRFAADNMLAPWFAAAQEFGLGAGAALPLMLHGRPRAILHLYAGEEDVLDAALIGLAEELAVDVGRALEAIDQQRHLDRLEALHAVLLAEAEVLLDARDEAGILHRTCIHLADSALFHVAWIARPDAGGEFRALAAAGTESAALARFRFALDQEPPSMVARTWRSGARQIWQDMSLQSDLERYRQLVERGGWKSAAWFPIRRGGELFAVLALGSPHAGLFTEDVLALCERVAGLLGRGLDEFDTRQSLEQERSRQFHLARHDPLTGLANRLLFEEHLALALARAERHGKPLAVCLLDLDDFKPINDHWGHAAGDGVLREVARLLSEALRRSDLVARLGGDEFVLALEDLGSVAALPGLLGRLSAAMEVPIALPDGEAALRCSVGVALFPEDGTDPDLLLRRADAALYAAKAEKTARTRNWRRWGAELAAPAAATPALEDAYGAEARRLLAASAGLWARLARQQTAELLRATEGTAAEIFAILPAEERAHLESRIGDHLIALLSPETDRAALEARARTLGLVHALIGVEGAMQLDAIARFQTRLGEALGGTALRPADRQNLMTVALTRLQADTAVQMEVRSTTIAQYFEIVLRPPPAASRWVDAVQAQLDAIAALPGLLSIALLQPDAEGVFQVLASASARGLSFARIREATRIAPQLGDAMPEGKGLVAACWRDGAPVSSAHFQTDPRTAPWHGAARRFGVRSAIVLPVHDADRRLVAVLILIGAYPGQFEAMWTRHFCAALAESEARLWSLRRHPAGSAVVPETTASAWRRLLFTGGLRPHYQPLVDLAAGTPVGAEALARIEQPDGTLVAPGRFLPVLGARELDELFRLVLAQALAAVSGWEREGLRLDVAVNLAPSTLLRPDCVFWVREALSRAGTAPGRLTLEITEDQSLGTAEGAAATLAALDGLGVRLAMDDLGAGFSSLERLRTQPFAAVKLDQNLILGAHHHPDRAMHFLGALVQLGRDLEIEVIAEGLESEDLVEAATVLGANLGQGYALARPMPEDAVAGWARSFDLRFDRAAPRSPLGALATLWRITHVGDAPVTPFETCPITRFMRARGLADGPLDALHRRLHILAGEAGGRRSPRYREESAKFRQALAAMTTGEAETGLD